MTISPARAGPNEINFFYFDSNGDDRTVEKVIARFSYLDFGAPPLEVTMDEAHPGHAFVIDQQIRHAGRWRIEATIKRRGLPDAKAAFDVTIR